LFKNNFPFYSIENPNTVVEFLKRKKLIIKNYFIRNGKIYPVNVG